jgi:hypothetical protein
VNYGSVVDDGFYFYECLGKMPEDNYPRYDISEYHQQIDECYNWRLIMYQIEDGREKNGIY